MCIIITHSKHSVKQKEERPFPAFPLFSFIGIGPLFQKERKHDERRKEEARQQTDAGQVSLGVAVIGVELELL